MLSPQCAAWAHVRQYLRIRRLSKYSRRRAPPRDLPFLFQGPEAAFALMLAAVVQWAPDGPRTMRL